jgi:hypothetical protein
VVFEDVVPGFGPFFAGFEELDFEGGHFRWC